MSTKEDIKKNTETMYLGKATLPNGKTLDHLKRQAVKLKKERGIPHQEALNTVIRANGSAFSSWQAMMQKLKSLVGGGSNRDPLPLTKKTLFTGFSHGNNFALNHWIDLLSADPDQSQWIIDFREEHFIYAVIQSTLSAHYMPPAKLLNLVSPPDKTSGRRLSHYLLANGMTLPVILASIFPSQKDQQRAHTYLMQESWDNVFTREETDCPVLNTLKRSHQCGLLSLLTRDPDYGHNGDHCFNGLSTTIALLPPTEKCPDENHTGFTELLRFIRLQQQQSGAKVRLVFTGMSGTESLPTDLKEWLLHSHDVEWVMSIDFPCANKSPSQQREFSLSEEAFICAEKVYLGAASHHDDRELPPSLKVHAAAYGALNKHSSANFIPALSPKGHLGAEALVLERGVLVSDGNTVLNTTGFSLSGRLPRLFYPCGKELGGR